jgi:hypothetical protein
LGGRSGCRPDLDQPLVNAPIKDINQRVEQTLLKISLHSTGTRPVHIGKFIEIKEKFFWH